jgi:PleD family two-component response regulator
MCQAVRELNIPHKESAAAPYVTISVGVTSALLATALGSDSTPLFHDSTQTETRCSSPTILVKTADEALDRAKTAGRSRALSARAHDVIEEKRRIR